MGLLYVGVVFVGGFLFCSCCLSVFVCFWGGQGFFFLVGLRGGGSLWVGLHFLKGFILQLSQAGFSPSDDYMYLDF